MSIHTDKILENKRQSVANPVSQRMTGGESAFQCEDNRPESIAQRKLQEMMNSSIHANQALQLKARVDNYSPQLQTIQKNSNNVGQSDTLMTGKKNQSERPLDEMKVHYNSDWSQEESDVMEDKALQGKFLPKKSKSLGEKRGSGITDVIQRKLYFGRLGRPRLVDPNLFERILQLANEDVTEEQLIEAFESDSDYFVEIRGTLSIRPSRSAKKGAGTKLLRLIPIIPTPTVAGRGDVHLGISDREAGFELVGRPGWTEEVVNAIQTTSFENIRHIIPFHLISSSFNNYLNYLFANFSSEDEIYEKLLELADATNATVSEDGESTTQKIIYKISIEILTRLNSCPANLWAGSAEENQRLNNLRMRMETLIKLFEDNGNKEQIIEELKKSASGRKSPEYVEMIRAAIENLSSVMDLDNETFQNQMELILLSAEIDVYPAIHELERIPNSEEFHNNIPQLMEIVELFQAGAEYFADGAVRLSNLPSPHITEEGE